MQSEEKDEETLSGNDSFNSTHLDFYQQELDELEAKLAEMKAKHPSIKSGEVAKLPVSTWQSLFLSSNEEENDGDDDKKAKARTKKRKSADLASANYIKKEIIELSDSDEQVKEPVSVPTSPLIQKKAKHEKSETS